MIQKLKKRIIRNYIYGEIYLILSVNLFFWVISLRNMFIFGEFTMIESSRLISSIELMIASLSLFYVLNKSFNYFYISITALFKNKELEK